MNPEKQLEHAVKLHQAGKTDAAERAYKKLLKQRVNHSEGNRLYGMLVQSTGRAALAEELFKRALKGRPSDHETRVNLVSLQIGRKAYDEAMDLLEQGLAGSRELRLICKLAEVRQALGQSAAADTLLDEALSLDPGGACIYLAQGEVRRRRGDYLGALRSFATASALEPEATAAQTRIKSLVNSSIQPWHFPMMNDVPRNEAYQKAIEAVVKDGDVVLDIGAGAGLLSLMAARAGAKKVYACDDNHLICHVARSIVERNGYGERIEVFSKRSTSLSVGSELPEKADVLVCEIFDVGVFGEDALNTVRDACRRLLVDNPRIVPHGVRVWVCPVQSDGLRNRFTVDKSAGFDVSPFNILAERRVLQVELSSVDYQPLAEPFMALEVAFGPNLELLGEQETAFDVTTSGRFDGYVIWYELLLGGDVLLSTAPTDSGTHWRQGFLPQWGPVQHLEPGTRHMVVCLYRRYLLWLETQRIG